MAARTSVCLAAAAIVAGCASQPAGKEATAAVQDHESLQIVRIETLGPAGTVSARCGVKNDRGASEILAPGVAEVIRSAKPLEVLCFAPGYRIAMRSLESTGDVIGPAATGLVAGGGIGAVAALPLLTVPVFGPLMYMGVVGGGALLGGAVNAADKHTQGKIYSYPPSAVISMVAENSFGTAPAAHARPLFAPEPVPSAAPAVLAAAPVATAAPMAAAALPPLLPIVHEVPQFPAEATQAGVSQGVVRALLSIDAEGHVKAVRIVEARPERVFDRTVNETLMRWKFARGAPDRVFDAQVEFRR